MKKLISLVLVLALCLTAVSALAETTTFVASPSTGEYVPSPSTSGGSGSGSGSGSYKPSPSASSKYTPGPYDKFWESATAASEFIASGDKATTPTAGLELGPVSDESKKLVNDLFATGNLVTALYANTIFVGDDAQPNGATLTKGTNVILVPMPTVKSAAAVVGVGEIVVPIPVAIAQFLLKNLNNIKALYTFVKDGQYYTYEVRFDIVKTGTSTYGIKYNVPAEVLKAAEGCPAFMDYELVK